MHDTNASIRRFLGPSSLTLGPFGLLGVDPRDCTNQAVGAALQQQLDRLSAHPEGDTPEADEVRLALHAAAAQLLDPRVRDHLAARWKVESDRLAKESTAIALEEDPRDDDDDADSKKPVTPVARRDIAPRRRNDDGTAKLIVGAAVVTVATIGLVIAAILVFARPPAAPAPAPAGTAAAGPAAAPAAGAATAVVDEEAERAQAASNAAPISQDSTATSGASARTKRTEFGDPRKTLKDLRDAAAIGRTDPAAAVTQLEPVIRQLSDWWAAFEPGVRRACDDALVEAFYAIAASPEAQSELHALIAEPAYSLAAPAGGDPRPRLHADDVWPAAWSIGMLTRLTRERDLPTNLTSRTSSALEAALGQSRPTLEAAFEAGAGLALRRLPPLLVTDPKARAPGRDVAAGPGGTTAAIKRWIEACSAIAPEENTLERLLCDGLEQILLNAKEPEEDLGVFEAIGAIAAHIKWRSGGPARPRLLDWFRDPRVSESDLRVITAAVAGRSSAEGVDPTMVLSVNPAVDDRSRLRAKYAEKWSIESAGGERASQAWLDAARALLDAGPGTKSSNDLLRDASAYARLNEAARLLWRGEGTTAESLLRDPVEPPGPNQATTVHTSMGSFLTIHITGKNADGSWAERYFAAERSIPARLDLLAQLEQGGRPVGAVDAAILVQEAVIGSPIQIRYAAARLVGLWADEATVVMSTLDELPLAPRTRTTAEMMDRITRQPLPPMTDPDWELAVRRALVERLLGMLASGSAEATLEHYASLIADSYLRAAGQESARGAGAAAEGARRGSELLWAAVRAEADAVAPVPAAPIPLDQIDRRRMGRRTLASGPVQAFAAEQVSIAEAMAYVVAGEKPTAAKRIEAAISRMQTARRAASHVFDQILATERAILEMWLLRFDQEPGGAI